MKFLTEEDLRKLYFQEPFVSYVPEPGTKLTPGARQFLADRSINLHANEPKIIPVIRKSLTREICCPGANPEHNASSGDCWREKTAAAKLATISAAFCEVEMRLQSSDAALQAVRQLHSQFDDAAQALTLLIHDMEAEHGK